MNEPKEKEQPNLEEGGNKSFSSWHDGNQNQGNGNNGNPLNHSLDAMNTPEDLP